MADIAGSYKSRIAARSALKLVATNALGVFIVFNIVTWTICLGFSIYSLVGPKVATFSHNAYKAELPNYANVDWARAHFAEFDSLSTKYVSYLGWRREPFKGTTIALVGRYNQRETVPAGEPGKPSVYFFGGSTMWGSGVNDANTIPSLVAQLSGLRSANYGETAYTAHQGLVLLIQLLQDGHRPDVVVFFDGVNEVAHKCRSELTPTSHARETQVRAALAHSKPENVYGLEYMAGPLMGLADRVSNRISVWTRGAQAREVDSAFSCHTDPARAQQIADNLIQDWEVARRLVESYKGKFVGILQPVAYYSDTKLDHLQLREILSKQYEAVYPLIKRKMVGQPGLYDFTGVLNKREYIYIDFCHMSPNGSRYIAQELIPLLAN
jgi:hypothetical protein